ncbi:MAG: 50S ribosomal protein L11 methyltransferase [Chloroflexi bacterium]|nr:50S ribosomal protein L11 methyltransferase [Chloroflexota bacterium]
MALDANMVIGCADGLTLAVAGSELAMQLDGMTVAMTDHSLNVLETFRVPRRFEDGVKRLEPLARNANEWMMLTREINRLLQAGVLNSDRRLPTSTQDRLPTPTEIKLHLDLLRDTNRTEAYLKALSAVVRPDDVVVDIGSGNGVLAMGAARAGARHVYAIEASPIAPTTRRIFEANGFGDRITLIEGWSLSVTLPEKADLVISEILSNDVFTENVLQATRDAERRFLKPGGRILPEEARIFGRLVTVGEGVRGRRTIAPSDVESWSALYDLDFTPLYESQWHGQTQTWVSPNAVVNGGEILSDSVLIGTVRLSHITSLSYSASAEVVCTRAGRLDGVIGHFELDVAAGFDMTTDPLEVKRANSWMNPLWFCEPVQVQPGDRVRLTLSHEHRDPLSVELKIELMTNAL